MTPRFDPLSPEFLVDPFPGYRALRDSDPVCALREGELYAVSRYEDVVAILRDDAAFSSGIMQDVFLDTESTLRGRREALEQARRILDRELPGFARLMEQRSMIAADGASHHELRHLVNRGFTPGRIGLLEKTAREITQACLLEASRRGALELIEELAAPLPCTVIAQLLGVEPERHADFRRWSNTVVEAVTGLAEGMDRAAAVPAFVEMVTHLNEVIETRRQEPREDLISTLVRAEDGSAALNATEVLIFVFGLLIAGNETTTNLIGNATLALLRHPAQLAAVRRDSELVPSLVEEALRYEGPIQALFRRATRDVTLAGARIPENAIVLALIGSANRDERRFPDPDRFDVRRRPQGHLAFGFGVHFCLGAALARLEARVALEAIVALPGLERAEDGPIERASSVFLRGPRRLPLRFTLASPGRD